MLDVLSSLIISCAGRCESNTREGGSARGTRPAPKLNSVGNPGLVPHYIRACMKQSRSMAGPLIWFTEVG